MWNTLLSMPANLFIGTRPEMINTNLDGIDIIHITTAQHVDVYMHIDGRSEEEQRMHWSPGVIPRCAYPAGSKVVLMLNSELRHILHRPAHMAEFVKYKLCGLLP